MIHVWSPSDALPHGMPQLLQPPTAAEQVDHRLVQVIDAIAGNKQSDRIKSLESIPTPDTIVGAFEWGKTPGIQFAPFEVIRCRSSSFAAASAHCRICLASVEARKEH